MMNIDTMVENLSCYRFNARKYTENDGSITLSVDDIDIVVNAANEEQAKSSLASDIKEYAEDYYEHYATWSVAPNRRAHIPYVLKVLSLDEAAIREEIVCRSGKN